MTDWRPSAHWDVLCRRAKLFATLRAFFSERGVLEVETPLLCSGGSTDPHLDSFSTDYLGPGAPAGRPLYLQTSPEFAMKRLLAAGSGPIYQITKAFRNGEAGRRHNPEFTLLEWYRPGFDHHALMDEVDALLQHILRTAPAARLAYADACGRYLGLDPHRAKTAELRACAVRLGLDVSASLADDDDDTWLQLLWTHAVEPELGRNGQPVFVVAYPASQAMLARVRPGPPAIAERFELYIDGLELANGFHELGDADEQRRRFAADLHRRSTAGLPAVPIDQHLLAALEHGLPSCSGVAVGVDRLMMVQTGARAIADVLSFPLERC